MIVRRILIFGVVACACSSETNPQVQGGTVTGGAGGTTPSGSRPTDGGSAVDSSGPELVDAEDAKLEADLEAGLKDAAADAALRVPSFIVVLGSSTAAGFGLSDPATAWVARYTTYLSTNLPGSRVTNLAVSGYTTYHILPTGTVNPAGLAAVDPAHNITAALALHPDAIIVNLPSNDAASGVSVEDTMTNFKMVAAKASEASVLIWICTSQPRQLAASGIALLLGVRDRVEQEFGDRAIDFFTPLAAADGTPLPMYNLGDGIHPNAEGHRLLFEQVRMADLPAAIAAFGNARD